MPQKTRDSQCHRCLIFCVLKCCKIHEQSLVQFNWCCEHEGDNDEALTWGRDLIILFSPKMSADVLYFSFSRSALADFGKERKEKQNNVCVQAMLALVKSIYSWHHRKIYEKNEWNAQGRTQFDHARFDLLPLVI